MTIVVSCDPGIGGACAVLDHNGLRAVFDLPTMEIPGVGPTARARRKIDCRALARAVRAHVPASEKAVSVIENIRSRGASSPLDMSTLMRTVGSIEAVFECIGMAPSYVEPSAWKRYYGLINKDWKTAERKRKSLECARRLYPGCNDIAMAKHDGRAEAILIAHWLQRQIA